MTSPTTSSEMAVVIGPDRRAIVRLSLRLRLFRARGEPAGSVDLHAGGSSQVRPSRSSMTHFGTRPVGDFGTFRSLCVPGSCDSSIHSPNVFCGLVR